MQAGNGVAQGEIGAHRALAGKTIDISQAANALTHRGIAGFAGVGSGLAVAGNARVDKPRVVIGKAVRAQAPVFHGAGAEVLDHHIRAAHQLAHQSLALLGLQIQGHGFLVAPQAAPPVRGAVLVQLAPATNGVTARGFHLHHIGTEIGQQGAGKRASQQLAQLDNTDTVQGQAAGWSLGHGTSEDCGFLEHKPSGLKAPW